MLKQEITQAIARTKTDIKVPVLQAFIATESSGKGFDKATGKIIIQFEPYWFSKISGLNRSKDNHWAWDENRVDVQSKEWPAFNEAFWLNPEAAMESTSIGLPQIMGFHWKRLGFDSVGAMWDFFKVSEVNQIIGLIKFIETDPSLHKAILDMDWDSVSRIYNGRKYKELAKKLGREPYDETMARYYEKFSKLE